MEHSIQYTIHYRDREHAGDVPPPHNAYKTLSLSSFSGGFPHGEYNDDSVLYSDSKVVLKTTGDVNELMHVEEAGMNVQYDAEERCDAEEHYKQSMYTTSHNMKFPANHVDLEQGPYVFGSDSKRFAHDPTTLSRLEADDYSSYGSIAFCVPKVERSANQTQIYSSKIVNTSITRPSPIVCTVRPFIISEEPLSSKVEPDCDSRMSKSLCCTVESMRHSTSPKTQLNGGVEIDALFSAANILHSTNIGDNARCSAQAGELIPEGLTALMSEISIKSSIEEGPFNVYQNVATAEHYHERIRAEENENTARKNVFQTMVSFEPVSIDIGRNEEQMQTDATDPINISKKDILIIHSEDDNGSARTFKEAIEKLCENKLTPGVTVDLQDHIDAGKQSIGSLDSLHDRYRCILIFVTNAFQADRFKKFHSECVLVFGLDTGGDKLNRVVPVWVDVTRRTCKIPYLKTFNGITYKGNTSNYFEEHMLKTVKHFRELIK